jgi:hypothetical protein
MRIVHLTLISRINKQFIHLNANCMNSTPSSSKCIARGTGLPKWQRISIRSWLIVLRTIYTSDQLSHSPHESVYSGLSGDVIVLDAVEKLRQTPERIGLDSCQYCAR